MSEEDLMSLHTQAMVKYNKTGWLRFRRRAMIMRHASMFIEEAVKGKGSVE